MLSMTGYCSLNKNIHDRTLQIDIRSVNSKYKDLRINASFCDNNFLEMIRKKTEPKIYRGQVTIDLHLKTDNNSQDIHDLDTTQLAHYIQNYEESFSIIPHDFEHVKYFLNLDYLVRKSEKLFDPNIDGENVLCALDDALDTFYQSRYEEGLRLKIDLSKKIEVISQIRNKIADKVPELEENYSKRLINRIKDFIQDMDEFDEIRILNEVAIQSVKSSVDEELVRLSSHLEKIRLLLESKELFLGKKIDFYMQEINREFNTIASKVSDVVISEQIVDSKVIIDQIREQAQNIV